MIVSKDVTQVDFLQQRTLRRQRTSRQGFVLLLVLVVIASLSLAIYGFTSYSLSNLEATHAHLYITKQRLLAESAIALSKSQMASNRKVRTDVIHQIDCGDGCFGHFAVVRDLPSSDTQIQFGVKNESAKLNLNSLISVERSRDEVIDKLMRSSNASASVAEAIADRIGAVREKGQTSMVPPRKARLEDLADLLKLPGVTPSLVFGEDQNRNGLLDENENDGSNTLPLDNADGKLDSGWSGVWTVQGGESNFRDDGRPKINLNQSNLGNLYDELAVEFGADFARFVVAWKVGAPEYNDKNSSTAIQAKRDAEVERNNTFAERMREQLGVDDLPSGHATRHDGSSKRAGISLSNKGKKIRSIFDLVGCKVQVLVNSEDIVITSPFQSDYASMHRWLSDWEERTTIDDEACLEGRVNINQASFNVLQSIDGMTESTAAAIIAIRESADMRLEEFSTVAWLVSRGLLTTAQLREMGSELTTKGSVFTGFAVGQLDSSRTATAIHFTVDARFQSVRIVRHLDLSPLQFHQRLRPGNSKIVQINSR